MQIIVGCQDRYLSARVSEILSGLGLKCIRTNKIERVFEELKRPERLAIVDMSWKELQEVGVLKQMVNIGNISGNKVICICPNQEEKLKKLAKSARPDEVFIRYDLYTKFKNHIRESIV